MSLLRILRKFAFVNMSKSSKYIFPEFLMRDFQDISICIYFAANLVTFSKVKMFKNSSKFSKLIENIDYEMVLIVI